MLTKLKMTRGYEASVRVQVWNQIIEQIMMQVEARVENQAENRIENPVWDQIVRTVGNHLFLYWEAS